MRNLQSPRQSRNRPHLTRRQKECLRLLADGKTTAAIALEIGITIRTVRFHLRNIKLQLDAQSLLQAVAIAVKMGLLDDED